MPLKSFIRNAAPFDDVSTIDVETTNGDVHTLSIDQSDFLIAAFSKEGKPLREDGPVHLYIADGIKHDPIRNVSKLHFN
ncbi:hypothetical protein [Bacillus sp. JCM 19041]|uniref:hypothetical protein n=1 Tax=Bacillus sp. JCM 19041 TaxID=1460637 RepID=UPI000AF29E76